jgi:hypothetical protein
MMHRLLIVFMTIILSFQMTRADEGMWLLSLINKNYNDLKAQGFKLTPEDIYSINKSSLKDAVCGLSNSSYPLGFFCTAEVISKEGLLLTNHHCSYDMIQTHSSVDHDYLTDGFWAYSKDKELPNEGICASFLVYMEDVTDSVLFGITDATKESDRKSMISKKIKELEKRAKTGNNYNVSVKPLFNGNQFFIFVYETYLDVRLVGAPPSAVGKFGGDTDNWMWPRHTGDFSMLRIYSSKENAPAEFTKDNVPYSPKHSLPVSIKGLEKDDFVMVMGFPGTTNRYLTSYGVQAALDVNNPATVKIRTKKLQLMKEDMDSSPEIRIMYSSKYASTANYWKYFIGQSRGLKRNDVPGQKQQIEAKYTSWANMTPERKEIFGNALSDISKSYEANKDKSLAQTYILEALLQGSDLALFPLQTYQLNSLLKNSPNDKEAIKQMTDDLKKEAEKFYKDFNPATDKKIMAALLEMYYKDVPKEHHPDFMATLVEKKFKGDFNKYTDEYFKKSIFADKARFMAFLDKPSAKVLSSDMGFEMAQQSLSLYYKFQSTTSPEFDKATRLFVRGVMEMQPEKLFYPDANSTPRITYGQVGDYKPADAVYYNFFTTIEGIMEKEDPKNDEFVVPAKLKQLYKAKDYGRYADKNGDLRICFTSNNDITGGNSGSPVINGNGELVGAAFDGNWEAMSGDIAFENKLQKTISVDIRYVLFIIDKYAGAKNLIDEMNIVQ